VTAVGTETTHGDSRSGHCLTRDHDHCTYEKCPCVCHHDHHHDQKDPT
jgi:hypothetical protein